MTTIYKFDEHIMRMGKVNEHDFLEFHWVTWVYHSWTNGEGSVELIHATPEEFLK